MGYAGSLLRLARPKQWTKNGFVLAGVVFAGEAFSASSLFDALVDSYRAAGLLPA